MNLNQVFNMSIDEFEKYLFEDDNNLKTNRIKDSGKTIKELFEDMKYFNNKLMSTINKYNLDYRDPILFITKICDLNEKELLMLILISLIDYDYLYSLKKCCKNKVRIERFLYIQEEIDKFQQIINRSRSNEIKYSKIIEKIGKTFCVNNNIIPKEKLVFIKKVFNEYISLKSPQNTNIEYIHSVLMGSKETQLLYPLILFKILIKFKTKICEEDIFVNLKSILNYKFYSIRLDNGKNFKTYGNYISLFLEILEVFSDICDKDLCMYGFYKSSNLVEWIFRSTLNIEVFNDTILAMVEEKYTSVFQKKSIYYDYIDTTEYIDFRIDGIKSNEFFSSIVEKELMNDEIVEFLDNYIKYYSNNKILIEQIKNRIFRKFNLQIDHQEDEFYILRCFEIALINRADNYIKDNIIKFIEINC